MQRIRWMNFVDKCHVHQKPNLNSFIISLWAVWIGWTFPGPIAPLSTYKFCQFFVRPTDLHHDIALLASYAVVVYAVELRCHTLSIFVLKNVLLRSWIRLAFPTKTIDDAWMSNAAFLKLIFRSCSRFCTRLILLRMFFQNERFAMKLKFKIFSSSISASFLVSELWVRFTININY